METAPLTPARIADLDRTGRIPMYAQLADRIEAAIRAGELPPGSRLEGEAALCDRLRISRSTIHRAIRILAAKGLVVNVRGVGTQVLALGDDALAAAPTPRTQLLDRRLIEADPHVASALGVAPHDPVVYLRRLRFQDGEPQSVLESYLPARFDSLDSGEVERFGLWSVLGSHGVSARVVRHAVTARDATQAERRDLELDDHGPVLVVERTTFDHRGRAVAVSVDTCRPDRYTFESTGVAM